MEMLKLILAKGANPNIRSNDTGETPLFNWSAVFQILV